MQPVLVKLYFKLKVNQNSRGNGVYAIGVTNMATSDVESLVKRLNSDYIKVDTTNLQSNFAEDVINGYILVNIR